MKTKIRALDKILDELKAKAHVSIGRMLKNPWMIEAVWWRYFRHVPAADFRTQLTMLSQSAIAVGRQGKVCFVVNEMNSNAFPWLPLPPLVNGRKALLRWVREAAAENKAEAAALVQKQAAERAEAKRQERLAAALNHAESNFVRSRKRAVRQWSKVER